VNDQGWIQKAKEQIFGAQRRRAIERRREKIEREKNSVEFELFMDTLAAEDIDVNTPAGFAVALRAWCLKQGEQIGDELPDDWDRTPGGPFLD
jgi:hypothetical protein